MNQQNSPRHNFKLAMFFVWVILTGAAITTSSFYLLGSFNKTTQAGGTGFYGAKSPQVMGASFSAESKDPRALKIENVFEKFKCPLAEKGEYIVRKADENSIPYWLVAAVSFQESGCGKITPKVKGAETYNAWGYGVFGGYVKTFESWEDGIETLSKYFSKRFYSKGITDPCEIMKTYTPPSKGSWCAGVNYFGQMIENFESE